MSEQKYDVFQVVGMIGTKRFQGVFTKSDLSKIMDGALYKEMKDVVEYRTDTLIESNTGWSFTDEIIGDIEWINPIIELVPVEEE